MEWIVCYILICVGIPAMMFCSCLGLYMLNVHNNKKKFLEDE